MGVTPKFLDTITMRKKSVIGKIVSRRASVRPGTRGSLYVICYDGNFQNLGTLDAKTVEDKFGYKNVPTGARIEIDATDLPKAALGQLVDMAQGQAPLPPQTKTPAETPSKEPAS